MIKMLFLLVFASVTYGHQYPVQLGDTKVIIDKQQFGAGKAFVHLHQNETTALKAAKTIAKKEGGSVLTLIHPGQYHYFSGNIIIKS